MKSITDLTANSGSPKQVTIGAGTSGASIFFGSGKDTSITRTSSGVLSLGSAKLQSSSAPTVGADLTNKTYVDGLAAGNTAFVLQPVRACQDPTNGSNVNIASPGATLDGVSLSVGDRIFLGAQTTPSQNGIWVWNGAAAALTRPTDFASAAVIKRGVAVFVLEGTNFQRSWVININATDITVDTTSQTWTQDGAPGFFRHTGGVLTARTDGTLNFGNSLTIDNTGVVSANASTARVEMSALATSTTVGYRSKVTGKAIYQYQVLADGKIQWGSGSATPDTNLYRLGPQILQSDGSLYCNSDIRSFNSDIFARDSAGDERSVIGQVKSGKGGLKLGMTFDTNLYREATAMLKTDSKLVHGAAVSFATVTKTTDYTVSLATDHTILVNSPAAARTITLPGTHTVGDEVIVKDIGGNASVNNITVATADTDTIDGSAADYLLTANYQSVTLRSDGTNWFIIS